MWQAKGTSQATLMQSVWMCLLAGRGWGQSLSQLPGVLLSTLVRSFAAISHLHLACYE